MALRICSTRFSSSAFSTILSSWDRQCRKKSIRSVMQQLACRFHSVLHVFLLNNEKMLCYLVIGKWWGDIRIIDLLKLFGCLRRWCARRILLTVFKIKVNYLHEQGCCAPRLACRRHCVDVSLVKPQTYLYTRWRYRLHHNYNISCCIHKTIDSLRSICHCV